MTREQASRPASEVILVVDDNQRVAELARWALDADGWRVRVERSSSAALRAAACEAFALALSDYEMPGGDGLQFLSALRRLQPDCSLLLWSTALPLVTAGQARELGVKVLPGKLLGEELCTAVGIALARRHSQVTR